MAKHGNKSKWFGDGEEGENIFNNYKNYHNRPFKVRSKKSKEMEEYGHGSILDSIFKESKVDKVISKYFEPSLSEINESVKRKKSKINVVMESVIKMTETIEQELAAKQFLKENTDFKFVGITNKKNLVFENKEEQVRISPEGFII
jgi:biotin-(acetyl-CoA carboxylase) ligase